MLEYEPLKLNDLGITIKRNAVLHDTLTALVHNVESLLKHVDNKLSHTRIIKSDIGFTKTQIKTSYYT